MNITMFLIMFTSNLSIVGTNIMTQDEMEKFVVNKVNVIEQKKGYVLFTYKQVKMALISDVPHDRMRIVAPITEYEKITPEQKDILMEANYHKALDARYAASNGVLYSAYIHPMSSLTRKELEGALNQVSTLALNFGSSYSSGSLSFGGK